MLCKTINWSAFSLSDVILSPTMIIKYCRSKNPNWFKSFFNCVQWASVHNRTINVSMDVASLNNTNQALLYNIYIGELPIDNISDSDVNVTKTITRLTSPLAVTIAVMLVFLFSPMILIGNSLVLVAMYRFKRLRTPSNYLIISLATSDLGIGEFRSLNTIRGLN